MSESNGAGHANYGFSSNPGYQDSADLQWARDYLDGKLDIDDVISELVDGEDSSLDIDSDEEP